MSHADLVALRGAHSIDGDDGPAKDCGCGANEPDADVSNALPTAEALKQCAELPVYDAEGKVQTFKSLVDGDGSGNKHMVVFIRHFFCGICQEYIRTLASSLPPSCLPPSATITIIGCGAPELIPHYSAATSSPYKIYCDPKAQLYTALGMIRTLSMGSKKAEYMHQSMLSASLKSVMQGLTWKGGRGALQGGDHKQNGGEFWFVKDKETKDATMGDWKVEWCHRMRNTRDHVEIADLREVMCKGCWCPEPNLATPRGRNEVKVKKEEREHGPTVTILDRHGRVKSEGSPKPKRRSRSSSLLRALSLRKNRERAESKERAGYAKLAEGGDRAIEVA